MNDLVIIDRGKAVVSTRVIADGVELDHKAVMFMVRKYVDDLNEVGTSDIQYRNFKTAGRPGEEALLDEDQSMYIVMLMRNSKITLAFKSGYSRSSSGCAE